MSDVFTIATDAGGHTVYPQSGSAASYALRWRQWCEEYTQNYTLEKIVVSFTATNWITVSLSKWYSGGQSSRDGSLGRQQYQAGDYTVEFDLSTEERISEEDILDHPSGYINLYASYTGWSSGNSSVKNITMTFYGVSRESVDKTTVVVTTVVAGNPQTVYLTNTAETANHYLTWLYDGNNGEQITSGRLHYGSTTRAPAWAVPASSLSSLYFAHPNQATAVGTVTVETCKSDGTIVDVSVYTAQLTLPSSIGPTITSLSITPIQDSVAQEAGVTYLQNHTSLRFAVSYQADNYGASVQSVRVSTPDGSITQLADAIRIQSAGEYPITATVTDSRGFAATVTRTLIVINCEMPTITNLTIYRCNDSGDEDDEGANLFIQATVTFTSIARGSAYYSVSYGPVSNEERTTKTFTNGGIVDAALDPLKSYAVTVTVTDSIGQSSAVATTISSASYAIYRMAGGQGVAFGKVSDKYGVEIKNSWPFHVHGQEIKALIRDAIYPAGSAMTTASGSFNPNDAFPGTQWALAGTSNTGGVTLYIWLRGR